MPVEPGQSLLHYRLIEKLGEGGMGVVWRATDTELDRDVAIKVLPDGFAGDAERLARFEREAKLLASLNHPNIASVFGLHRADGVRFLAMELVEGEDLADRLARGPLPVDEAMPLARDVAGALEAAHEAGVIHRDLKPANIRLTTDGGVKVLDFGLAKAFDAETTSGEQPQRLSQSPTMTSAGTVAGVILGTAGYMSPEQARGRPVDRRADIWAFGTVLWEMLTGRRLFEGETVSDTLAAVLRADPDWAALPPDAPHAALRLTRRCLQRDPKRRLQAIGDARVEIEEWLAGPDDDTATAAGGPGGDAGRTLRARLPWLIAAAACALATLAVVLTLFRPPRAESPALRAQVVLAPRLGSVMAGFSFLPDGSGFVYPPEDFGSRLQVRRLAELEPRAVAGTEGARDAQVSPDGRWIAFTAGTELRKVAFEGGASVVLAETTMEQRGISWSTDGYIYYVPGSNHAIWRVPADGGEAQPVTELPDPESSDGQFVNSHRWPSVLPGDRAILYLAGTAGDFEQGRIEVLDLTRGTTSVLYTGGLYPRYVPGGHIAFVYDGTLMVMGFDPRSLEATSAPRALVDSVQYTPSNGSAMFGVSSRGALLYVPGSDLAPERAADWALPDGTRQRLIEPFLLFGMRFSPDGRYLAYVNGMRTNADIWIQDLERGVSTRLTQEPRVEEVDPVWSPDSRWVFYAAGRDGPQPNIYRMRADGSGEPVPVLSNDRITRPLDLSSDGRMLLLSFIDPSSGSDLALLRLDPDGRPTGEPEIFASSEGDDGAARFSPDNRWIVYQSGKLFQTQIYLRARDGGGRWQISRDGGIEPAWDWVKHRILFVQSTPDKELLMAVSFAVKDGQPVIGPPEAAPEGSASMFDVHPDGRVLVATQDTASDPISHPILIEDWYRDF